MIFEPGSVNMIYSKIIFIECVLYFLEAMDIQLNHITYGGFNFLLIYSVLFLRPYDPKLA